MSNDFSFYGFNFGSGAGWTSSLLVGMVMHSGGGGGVVVEVSSH